MTLTEQWPLTGSIQEFADVHGVPVQQAAWQLLYHVYNVPVTDVKGQPRRMTQWIPSTRIGDGLAGPLNHYRVMVIGKMPGSEEILAGRTWCGPSGQLLQEFANYVGIGTEIQAAYGANVLRFIPFDGGKTLRPHHKKDCAFFLAQDMALVKPEFLLLLGADAVKAVMGKAATVGKVRSHRFVLKSLKDLGTGRYFAAEELTPEEYVRGIKVFATIHPRQVIAEASYRPGFERDLAEFKNMLHNEGQFVIPGRGCDYRYVDTPEALAAIVEEVLASGCRELAVDCEWGGGDFMAGRLRTIQFSWKEKTSCVVVLRRQGLREIHDTNRMLRILELLRRLFCHEGMQVFGHNMRADALWLEKLGLPVMERLSWDTMLCDHMLNENAEHGLEMCAVRYTDMGRYDLALDRWLSENKIGPDRIKREGYSDVPDDLLHLYAACDTDATWRIKKVQEQRLAEPANAGVRNCFFNVVMPCTQPIHEIEATGILADFELMEDLVYRYDAKKDELIHTIREKINNPTFNFRSYPQISHLLFGKPAAGGLGLTPLKTTGKPSKMWADLEDLPEADRARFNPSTDGETLEALGDQHEICSLLRDVKIIDQIAKSFLRLPEEDESGELSYIKGLVGSIDSDGRIRTTINQMSETGRHKSSRPNLQNLPKKQDKELERIMGGIPKIRSCFTVAPGRVLIEADYKSAEIFTLGFLSNCHKLVTDARSDLHARGAVTRMGAPKWDGFDQNLPPDALWLELYKAIRVASKTISFGIPYQRGAAAIAREIVKATKGKVDCDTQRAQMMIDGFYEEYREVRWFVDMCQESVLDPMYLDNPFGRRRRFSPNPNDRAGTAAQQREAVNFPIQGTVADTLNTALYNLWLLRKMNPDQAKYKILLAVHDAIILEAPVEYVGIITREILPACMTIGAVVPSWRPVPHWKPTTEFTLDIDIEVMLRWGEKLKSAQLAELGIAA